MIDLAALQLPQTVGYIIQPIDSTHSTTNYEVPTNFLKKLWYQENTGIINGVRLGTFFNIWVQFEDFLTPVEPARDDKVIIDLVANNWTTLNVDAITYQITDKTTRYSFTGIPDFHQISYQSWIKITNAVNSENNGIFKVIHIGNDYIDVVNSARTDSSKDEAHGVCIATFTQVFLEFQISDIKREIFSQFKDHYSMDIISFID